MKKYYYVLGPPPCDRIIYFTTTSRTEAENFLLRKKKQGGRIKEMNIMQFIISEIRSFLLFTVWLEYLHPFVLKCKHNTITYKLHLYKRS